MASSSTLSLKLLIDQTANRVVFAEACKETIDFLFSILTLPVGTVLRLLSELGMVGCLANLYQSVENLKEEYLLPNLNKDILLKPNACTSTQEVPLLLLNNTTPALAPKKRKLFTKFYVCNNSNRSSYLNSPYSDHPHPFHTYVTVNPETPCPTCKCCMSVEVNLLGDIWEEETVVYKSGGFVKGVATYMVLDDLVVKPLSTVSSVALLKKMNVDVDALDEKVVNLNMDMGLRLLKMAFLSKEVLTSVFLRQEDPIVENV